MLKIDNKKFEIIKRKIYVGNIINNGDKGYNICLQLEFINIETNEKGYINLDAGFEKKDDANCFLNKQYRGIPFDNDDGQYIFFEVYDGEKFLDTEIESAITVKFKNIKENKIETIFEVDDELIKINFEGYLDLVPKV